MTTSLVTYDIQEEKGGILRLRLSAGRQKLQLVYEPRTESDGWTVGISAIFPSNWVDPLYPNHFMILVDEENFSPEFQLKDEIDLHLVGTRLSEAEVQEIYGVLEEFFARVPV